MARSRSNMSVVVAQLAAEALNAISAGAKVSKSSLNWEKTWMWFSWGRDSELGSGVNSVSVWLSVNGYFVGISWL